LCYFVNRKEHTIGMLIALFMENEELLFQVQIRPLPMNYTSVEVYVNFLWWIR